MDRKDWRLVVNVHVAEEDEQALREVESAERHETVTYFEETLAGPPGRADDPCVRGEDGTTLVGSPETVIRGIGRLQELSQGGFGGILFRAHEWANREKTLKSYELFAATSCRASKARSTPSADRTSGRAATARPSSAPTSKPCVGPTWTPARPIPAEYRQRTSGARDVEPPAS